MSLKNKLFPLFAFERKTNILKLNISSLFLGIWLQRCNFFGRTFLTNLLFLVPFSQNFLIFWNNKKTLPIFDLTKSRI